MSTLEWTSEIRTSLGKVVIVLDVEQVNALTFFLSRELALERPLFHYVEYGIRVAEWLVGQGREGAALRLARQMEERLQRERERRGQGRWLPRPLHAEGVQLSVALSRANGLLAFVLGHEVGHYFSSQGTGPTEALTKIGEIWHAQSHEEWRELQSARVHRFLKPDIRQKLNEEGLPAGTAFLGSHRIRQFPDKSRALIEESQCDFLGLVAFTWIALERELPADLVLPYLLTVLMVLERLSLIQRVVPQIPPEPRRGILDFGFSELPSRVLTFLFSVEAIRRGQLAAPDAVKEYWRSCEAHQLDLVQSPEAISSMVPTLQMSSVAARGAVYLGLGAEFPKELESDAELLQKWGPLAGGLMMERAPFRFGEGLYDLSMSGDQADESSLPGGLVGFATALRDATEAILPRDRALAEESEAEAANLGLEELLRQVRAPRIAVRTQQLPIPLLGGSGSLPAEAPEGEDGAPA